MNNIGATKLQILRYFGIFTLFVGILCILPSISLIFYPSEYPELICFLVPGFSYLIIGLIISLLLKNTKQNKLKKNEDSLILVIIWIYASILASVPYIIKMNSFSKAMFEIVSGFSTTGFSVLGDYGNIYIFYRSLTHLVGGIGIVLIFTSVLSDSFGLKLYTAEGHNDRLIANLVRSSRLFICIYLGYVLLGFIAYLICGMGLFDALIYSMSAVSTGGVGTYGSNLIAFSENRLAIEIVTIVLMILGSLNFVIHTFLLKAKFRKVWNHSESKFYVIFSIISIIFITISVKNTLNYTFSKSFRLSIFNYFSAITGTGYQTIISYDFMPSTMIFAIIISMLIGGSVGSCAGGIKQYRICLMLKSMHWNFLEMNHSKNIIIPHYINRYDKKILVSDKDILDNYFYIINYILFIIIGVIILTLFKYDLTNSLFNITSAIGNVGLTKGIDFNHVNKFILWFFTFIMFVGRLEIIAIFKAIFRVHGDIKNKL